MSSKSKNTENGFLNRASSVVLVVVLAITVWLADAREVHSQVAKWVNPNDVAQAEFIATEIDSQKPVAVAGYDSSSGSPKSSLSGVLGGSIPEWGGINRYLGDQMANLDWQKVVASLAMVIGGYLGFLWLVRILNPGATRKLPTQVVEVIGQAPFSAKQKLQLVKLGNRLLLLLVGTDGAQSIGEVSDPAEVEHLISLCGRRPGARRSVEIPSRGRVNLHGQDHSNALMQQFVATMQQAMRKAGGQTEYEA